MRQRPGSGFRIVIFVGCGGAACGGGGVFPVDLSNHGVPTPTATWTTGGPVAGERAYSFATSICNNGPFISFWDPPTGVHPVSTSNLYVIRDGLLRQIGMSWAFHEMVSSELDCGPCGGAAATDLGVRCRTYSTHATNGQQGLLFRRSEVNATTGAFTFPGDPSGEGGELGQRLRVQDSEITPGYAKYYVETMFVARDDAITGTPLNNAAWRNLVFLNNDIRQPFPQSNMGSGSVMAAWRLYGDDDIHEDPEVMLDEALVDGWYTVGSRIQNIGGGRWRYMYVVHNLDSDRAARALSVPITPPTVAGDLRFHDPEYHSGEIWDNADWTGSIGLDVVRWESPATFAQDPNTNALRWATAYSFVLEADALPVVDSVLVEMFKPGDEPSFAAAAWIPSGVLCPTDIDGDGATGFADLNRLLGDYGDLGPEMPSDIDGDGDVDFGDLNLSLGSIGLPCR